MRLTPAQLDRACGVLLGQACGDALGVPYEFNTPPGPDELAVMRGGGLGSYTPGEWSDDTQMAACIAAVSATGADLSSTAALDEIAVRFEEWRRSDPADIGAQTESVLTAAARRPGSPSTKLREAAASYAAKVPRSAGNGALMRTAVVGISSLEDRDRTAASAGAIAGLTHADPLAEDSCVLWSEAVRVAVRERRLDLAGGLDLLPSSRRDKWRHWISYAEARPATAFNPNGFTVTALQAAWAAIRQTPVPLEDPARWSYPCLHLQHALHAAVRVGHDTDTVAAIAGGLLGAYWGASAVPADWARVVHGWPGLRGRDLVRLAALTVRGGRSDTQGWPAVSVMAYDEPPRPAVPLPFDEKLLLGTANTTVEDRVTAVVSLCRLGTDEAPVAGVAPTDHVEVRLIDSDDPEVNPNLAFVLSDTAQLLARLRGAGHRVLVHCVRAEQRTPAVALAYGLRRGLHLDEASQQVAEALPQARRSGLVWEVAATTMPGPPLAPMPGPRPPSPVDLFQAGQAPPPAHGPEAHAGTEDTAEPSAAPAHPVAPEAPGPTSPADSMAPDPPAAPAAPAPTAAPVAPAPPDPPAPPAPPGAAPAASIPDQPTSIRLPRSRPLNREDLDAMPEDGHRYELIDGALIVTPAPPYSHQVVLGNLLLTLSLACPEGLQVLLGPFDVALGDDTVVRPDLVVSPRAHFTEQNLPAPPLLVVEVQSPSTARIDLTLKRSRYSDAGCAAYWVVDPEGPRIIAWALEDGSYGDPVVVAAGDSFHAVVPFEVTVAVSDLLA